jgi:hypothetical protein
VFSNYARQGWRLRGLDGGIIATIGNLPVAVNAAFTAPKIRRAIFVQSKFENREARCQLESG